MCRNLLNAHIGGGDSGSGELVQDKNMAVVDFMSPLPRVINQLCAGNPIGKEYQLKSSTVAKAAFGDDFVEAMCAAAQAVSMCLQRVRKSIGAHRTAHMSWYVCMSIHIFVAHLHTCMLHAYIHTWHDLPPPARAFPW